MLRDDCPRCGFTQGTPSESCAKCGVVFAKLTGESRPPSGARSQLATVERLAEPAPRSVCRFCRRGAATTDATFRQNVGALFMRFQKTASGPMCRSCVDKHFWSYTLTTTAVGWLGTISLFLAPVFVVGNIVAYAGARRRLSRGATTMRGAFEPR